MTRTYDNLLNVVNGLGEVSILSNVPDFTQLPNLSTRLPQFVFYPDLMKR
jgi:hypothetical protein